MQHLNLTAFSCLRSLARVRQLPHVKHKLRLAPLSRFLRPAHVKQAHRVLIGHGARDLKALDELASAAGPRPAHVPHRFNAVARVTDLSASVADDNLPRLIEVLKSFEQLTAGEARVC